MWKENSVILVSQTLTATSETFTDERGRPDQSSEASNFPESQLVVRQLLGAKKQSGTHTATFNAVK